jgi:lipoprotein-releasing system ATP-binding protein
MSELLRLTQIQKSYGIGTPIETEVLHGIDLVMQQQEFAALIGPSGSGKSTLLNIISLLEPATQGAISMQGKTIDYTDEKTLTQQRAANLGFVFQFHHLLPAFSAIENVMMPRLINGMPTTGAARKEAEALLSEVGLSKAMNKKPSELSGGMQQRVAIARALSLKPALVLADEPSGNLDTQTADEIFKLLRRFNTEFNTAFLIVTHDPRLAARCDRIVELVDGNIAKDMVNQAR